jgi:hypothetical protein
MAWARRRVTKLLLCPVCGEVVVTALYTRYPWNGLVLTSVEGNRIIGVSVGLELRRAEEHLQRGSAAERAEPQERITFLRGHLIEVIHDLRCHHGHSSLRTMPQIVEAMVRTPGQWVTP